MSYEYWSEKEKEIQSAKNKLIQESFTEELHNVYQRQLDILEEILIDLEPELSDDQYTGTVAWNYEDELKQLQDKQEALEIVAQHLIEKKQHERLLENLNMNQEQYDISLREQAILKAGTARKRKHQ